MKYVIATLMALFATVSFAAEPAKKDAPKADTKKEVKAETKKDAAKK